MFQDVVSRTVYIYNTIVLSRIGCFYADLINGKADLWNASTVDVEIASPVSAFHTGTVTPIFSDKV